MWALDREATNHRCENVGGLGNLKNIKCSQEVKIRRWFRNRLATVSILSERPVRKNRFQKWKQVTEIKLKSLILAQIERWRHALHMQVER